MKTVKRDPGETEPRYREWFNFYRTCSVQVHRNTETPLLRSVDFPDEQVVLSAIKVDTQLPYPALADLWIELVIDDPGRVEQMAQYEFPCAAFDRDVTCYEVVERPDADPTSQGQPIRVVELSVAPPKFVLPVFKNKGTRAAANLFWKKVPEIDINHNVSITFMGATARGVEVYKYDARIVPPPHPQLGYCAFCEGHPNQPRKVPAVTRTQDGTPRCGPCGRWVD